MAKLHSPIILIIMDGFGVGKQDDPNNAIAQAELKNFLLLQELYPHTELNTSGMSVGLPDGQMGNSEVGHLNIGGGRIVYQELTRISKDITEGFFFKNEVLQEALANAEGKALHLVGLLSDGGVHSHMDHLKALLSAAKHQGIEKVFVHAFLDGRDVPPTSAGTYISDLESYMTNLGCGCLATISGRYYGMDRDKRWERIQLAYEAIVDGKGLMAKSAEVALQDAYERGETDEFVKPTVMLTDGQIKEGDSVIFFNFRPDRARQITAAFTLPDFDGFVRNKNYLPLYFATMTKYEENLPAHVIYKKEPLTNTLGEIWSNAGYTQLRIAETEKYAHVTYFFNGGEEAPFPGEDRILVKSPKVATYDLQPSMSAYEVTDKVIEAIRTGRYDLIILNFANPDMVGHTGVFAAAKKAVETVDDCLGKIVRVFRERGGHILVTADHGNAEEMFDYDGLVPHTAHTTNPVPFLLISEQYKNATLKTGSLCDIAPTILALADVEQPPEMIGRSLIIPETDVEV